jgi:hypothetical protein
MAQIVPITKVVYVERSQQRSCVSGGALLAAVAGGGAIWALIVTVIWLILEGL